MPDTTVQYFWDLMPGIPAISGTAGTLTTFLKACLVDGGGSVTVASLVVASGVATAFVNAGHGLAFLPGAYPVVEIGGASPTALNGRWRVASVPNTTTFTFACPGIPDQTATGTITSRRASLGWEVAYSGTNKMVFRSLNPASPQPYLWVDDTATAMYAAVKMFETMTDVDTGSDSTSGYIYKSLTANATTRWAQLFGDDRAFYLKVVNGDNQGYYNFIFFFGDILSYKSGDAFASAICSGGNLNSSSLRFSQSGVNLDRYLLRSYTQAGGQVGYLMRNHAAFPAGNYFGNQDLPNYPNPVDNAFHGVPIEVWESNRLLRGVLPGVVVPLHDSRTITENTVVSNVLVNGSLRVFNVREGYASARFAFDLTGPWR